MKAITTPLGHMLVDGPAETDRPLFNVILAKHVVRDALEGYASKGEALKSLDFMVETVERLLNCPECGGEVSRRCLNCDQAGQ